MNQHGDLYVIDWHLVCTTHHAMMTSILELQLARQSTIAHAKAVTESFSLAICLIIQK